MEIPEKTITIHNNNYETNEENSEGIISSSCKEQKKMFQEQYELRAYSTSEPTSGPAETPTYQANELSAVDLRMMKPSSECFVQYNENSTNTVTMANLLPSVYSNESNHVNVDSLLENTTENMSYETYIDVDQVSLYDCSTSHQIGGPQKKYTLRKRNVNNQSFYRTENSSDYVLFLDQETQTEIKESIEVSVQTDKDLEGCAYPLVRRKNSSSINYSCLVCRRFYATKSSFDRHARSHVRTGKKRFGTNLDLDKESKLQILQINRENDSDFSLPVASQDHHRITEFQCKIFCEPSSSELASGCTMEPFPLTKCKLCNVRFYTSGAIQDHLNFVHKTCTSESNAYCCIFCNNSFESSFSFQLHLDKHLAP